MSVTVRSFGSRAGYRLVGVGVVLAVTLGGCGGSDEAPDGTGERYTVPPVRATAAPPKTTTGAAPDGLPVLALSTQAKVAERPAWMFPVSVDGWKVARLNERGVNQLVKGRTAAFTTFQIDRDPDADTGNDQAASRAFLERFLAKLGASDEVTEVGEPVYDTATVKTRDGLQQIEMVRQEVTYTGKTGTTYRSRYLARALGDTLMAVQYDEPEDTWSEQQWDRLTDSLSIDVTLTGIDR
jgi:hypothetical protein